MPPLEDTVMMEKCKQMQCLLHKQQYHYLLCAAKSPIYNSCLLILEHQMTRVIFLLLTLASIAACNGMNSDASTYPMPHERERRESYGSLTGEDGLVIFGGKKRGDDGVGISINGYLWRGALETIYFMPLISTDPFGGVILTDWYSDPAAPHERFKLNIMITSRALRSDGIKVSVFKQTHQQGRWIDAAASEQLARQFEESILLKARQLKVTKAL
jgi:hypothetical protein